jgi:DNA-binding transcriptional regulator YiaG
MKFRNVDVDTSRPLDEWPAEAIETVIDRGSRTDWARLVAAIDANPWGPAARTTETVARWGEHYGVDALMLAAISRARQRCDATARRRYADRLRALRLHAGLSLRELAVLAGTSASRLSDYENAKVAPTTDVLGRIEQVVERARTRLR